MSQSRRARVAVTLAFFANGAIFANWVPRIPAVQERLDLTTLLLGLALMGIGTGGLLSTLVGGLLVERFGSRVVLRSSTLALGGLAALPGLVPTWWSLFLALAFLGAADAVMDVAMNAHGLEVEEQYRRSLLSGFHAWWSIGAVLGGAAGAGAAKLNVSVALHLAVAGGVLAVLAVTSGRYLLRSSPAPGGTPVRAGARAFVNTALLIVGGVTFLAAVIEDVPSSWSAVYLTSDLAASPGVAGFGFVAFAAAMTAGRLVGDRVIDRVGSRHIVQYGAGLVCVAFTLILLVRQAEWTILGFALAGIGASPFFPVAFQVAASVPGVAPGAGVAVVSLVSRVGFLGAPPAVGALADVFSLRASLSIVPVAAVGTAIFARAAQQYSNRLRREEVRG